MTNHSPGSRTSLPPLTAATNSPIGRALPVQSRPRRTREQRNYCPWCEFDYEEREDYDDYEWTPAPHAKCEADEKAAWRDGQ